MKESPQAAFISTDFGEYRAEVESNEETLFYTRKCSRIVDVVPQEDISAYMGFRKQVASSDQAQVVFKRKM